MLIQKDFNTCSGVRCYLQTAVKTAPDFLELFRIHFRHSKNEEDLPCPWSKSPTTAQQSSVSAHDVQSSNSTPSSKPISEAVQTTALPATLTTSATTFTTTYASPDSYLPDNHHLDTSNSKVQSSNEDLPAYDHSEDRSWQQQDENKYGPFRMPHPAPRHKYFNLIIATTAVLVSIIISASLLKALHYYCTNPRVRADRAARREERRTRREYRQAACQHRCRQFLARFSFRRNFDETGEYEEKRQVILNEHNNHLIGANILGFFRAQEAVSRRVHDEESSKEQPFIVAIEESIEQVRTYPRGPPSLKTLRSVSTLPLYTPNYSQNLGNNVEVLAGFNYTSSGSETSPSNSSGSFILDDADICTESSVVDCRSRLSVDTGSLSSLQV